MQAQPTAFSHKEASEAQLNEFMLAVVPNYDADRVHLSDIRKLVQWYNILVTNGYTEFSAAEAQEAETVEA
jgi:dephospho-CoA kinase